MPQAVAPSSVPDTPLRRDAPGLRVPLVMAALALLIALVAASLAWRSEQRLKALEPELVRRQQEVQQQSTEARLLSKQTQEGLSESSAKISLLEARLSEVAVQRSQLEDLIQSLSRSRDENIVVDIESALRVAQQQSAISGSAEPLVAVLRQSDERLQRYNQPRLEGVRRAIARDLDRVRKVAVADIGSLVIRLDEAVRMVDELPLLSVPEPRAAAAAPVVTGSASASGHAVKAAAAAAAASASPGSSTRPAWFALDTWNQAGERLWAEVRSLVRVTRINRPEAMLVAPDQAFFLRENLKLRLLNARLALLSRQFDTAQADLQTALEVIDRYHDRSSRRTQLAQELLRQVAAQARQGSVPRPDDTLAALAAAAAGR
jgi:uroporphyrin-III C-methyltransferase